MSDVKDRVRIAYIAKNLNVNGVSSVIINYAQMLDCNKYSIDIYAGRPISDISIQKLAECRNVTIIETPNKNARNAIKYYRFLKKHLVGYDIVHIHGNSRKIIIELLISRLNKNKKNIAHCHSCTCNRKCIHLMLRPFFGCTYDVGIAPSEKAGKWMFGNEKFLLVSNGINVEKYKYSDKDRGEIRRRYNIRDEEFIIGHVGNFSKGKNYKHIIRVFDEICEKSKKYRLLLVGKYQNNPKLYADIINSKNSDKIVFCGATDETSRIYSAMDCFVFPSKYEGFGIALIEAQCNGLPCVISDTIPKQAVVIPEIIKSIKLKNIDGWTDSIISLASKTRKNDRLLFDEERLKIIDSGEIAKQIESIYEGASYVN